MKVSELEGAALGWAVAKSEGLLAFGHETDGERLWITLSTGETQLFAPHINWAQAGPIIERERIRLDPRGVWVAGHDSSNDEFSSPTPLIAAMRCYVAAKLGDEIEVPEEVAA